MSTKVKWGVLGYARIARLSGIPAIIKATNSEFYANACIITVETKEGKKEISVESCERYVLEVADFADAILNNRKPMLDINESIRNMKIMDKLLALR